MTDKEKKIFLEQIKQEWENNSPLSRESFAEEHIEELQFLYINGYLKQNFYYKHGYMELVLSPRIKFPLSKKGEQFLSTGLMDRLRDNSLTTSVVAAIALLGFLTWILANNAI